MITIQLLTRRYSIDESYEDIKIDRSELDGGETSKVSQKENVTRLVLEAMSVARESAKQKGVITAPEEGPIVSDPSFPVGGLHVLRRYEDNNYHLRNLVDLYRETTRKNPQSAPILALKKSHP